MTRRQLTAAQIFGVVLTLAWYLAGFTSASSPAALPEQLNDQDFWKLSQDLSESNGYFRSDNLLSNETDFPYVMEELKQKVKPGGVFLGVGPEQSFNYIAAIQPRMAFIIDIRRDNMLQHFMEVSKQMPPEHQGANDTVVVLSFHQSADDADGRRDV